MRVSRIVLVAIAVIPAIAVASAQRPIHMVDTSVSSAAQDRSRVVDASVLTDAVSANKVVDPTYIPADSKVYVADIEGMPHFEINLMAAFQKKKVRLVLVTDKSIAAFEISGYAQSNQAGWPKQIFGTGLPESEASIQVLNLKTGVIAYAVSSYKVNSINGNKSTAEHLAKNLRQKMERDDKRFTK